MPHKWTKEEEQYILDNYKYIDRLDIAKHFGISKSSIDHKYKRLGIPPQKVRGKNYQWSEEEIQYLKDNWLIKTNEEIWYDLKINETEFSSDVIKRKRYSLGLIGKLKIISKFIRMDKYGYKYYIDYDKKIFTHRENMEKHLGRKLLSTEKVHHIDGDKSNDDIDNLYLCKDNSEHTLIHDQLEKIAMELVRNGTIKFNRDIGQYYL